MAFNGNGDYTPEEQKIIDKALETDAGFKSTVIIRLHRISHWIETKEEDCNGHKNRTDSLEITRHRLIGALVAISAVSGILAGINAWLAIKLLDHLTLK